MLIKISTQKFSTGNFLFFIALALFIIRNLIRSSLLLDLLPGSFSRALTVCVLGLLIIKLFVEDAYPSKLLVYFLAIFMLTGIIVIKDSYSILITTFALIASAYNVKFDGILKCIAIAISISSAIVIISCAIGLIPDYTFSHHVVSFINEGHSLGFNYYSTLGYIVMTLSAIFLYFHRKCRYFSLLLLALINCALFVIHTTTLSIVVGLGMIVAYIFTLKIHWLKFKREIWRFIAAILVPLCLFINFGLVLLYGNENMSVTASFLSTIRGRLEYSVQALNEYGIHWLGEKVTMYGRTASTYGDAESSFFIDSGYIYFLIAYGILFTAAIIVLYIILSQHIYKIHDPYLCAWFAIIVVICMINNFILSYTFNPFVFLIPSALLELNKRRSVNFAFRKQNNVSTQR